LPVNEVQMAVPLGNGRAQPVFRHWLPPVCYGASTVEAGYCAVNAKTSKCLVLGLADGGGLMSHDH
jgi:hypothetical protein